MARAPQTQAAHQGPADPQLLALKVPPHSVEAEQSLIGGLLLDNHAFDRIAKSPIKEIVTTDTIDHSRGPLPPHVKELSVAKRTTEVKVEKELFGVIGLEKLLEVERATVERGHARS